MLTTTLSRIRTHSPCASGWRTLLTALGKTEADDEPLTIETILETNGLNDALWALRAVEGHQKSMRLYACYCARLVLPIFEKEHPDDKRPRQAIETSERFAHGKATQKELAAAWEAAWEAGSATAYAAADAAAGYAAGYAARTAAGYAARTAAGYAARTAAGAARTAAGPAAKADMAKEFIRLCNLEGEYAEVRK